jgi:hypothetical protein
MNRTVLFLFVLSAFMLQSCGWLGKGVKNGSPEHRFTGSETPVSMMEQAAATFGTLGYNAQLNILSGGSENSVNVNIRISKDSLIWISARKLGFEIGRLMLSRDSVWLMDRISSRYFAGDYAFFRRLYGLEADYDMVEALLLGNPLKNWSAEPMQTDCSAADVCTLVYPERYRINQGLDGRAAPEGSTVMRNEVMISRQNGRVLRNSLSIPGQNRQLVSGYDRYTLVQKNLLLPLLTGITITDQGKETVITIIADGFKTGEAPSFPFKIPTSYQPLEIGK